MRQDVFVAIYRGLKSFRGEVPSIDLELSHCRSPCLPSGAVRRMSSFLSLLPWHEAELEPRPDPAEKHPSSACSIRMLAKLSPQEAMVLSFSRSKDSGVNEIASVKDVLPTRSGPGAPLPGELVRAARRIAR